MKKNPLKQLDTLGQSIRLDYLRRDLIAGGGLRRLIEGDDVRGMETLAQRSLQQPQGGRA